MVVRHAPQRCMAQQLPCAELYANQAIEEQKIQDIMEMGFTKDQAKKALDLCGMDKQAAIEHILTSA